MINLISNNYCTCQFNSAFFVTVILCGAFFGRLDPGINYICCQTLLISDNPVDISSTIIPLKSNNNPSTFVRIFSVSLSSLGPLGITTKEHYCFSSSSRNSFVEHISTRFSQYLHSFPQIPNSSTRGFSQNILLSFLIVTMFHNPSYTILRLYYHN